MSCLILHLSWKNPRADQRSELLSKHGGTIWPPRYKWTCLLCKWKNLLWVNDNTFTFVFSVYLTKMQTYVFWHFSFNFHANTLHVTHRASKWPMPGSSGQLKQSMLSKEAHPTPAHLQAKLFSTCWTDAQWMKKHSPSHFTHFTQNTVEIYSQIKPVCVPSIKHIIALERWV